MFTPKDSTELIKLFGLYTDIDFDDGIAPFIGALKASGTDTKEHFSYISDIFKILDRNAVITRIAKGPTIFIPTLEENTIHLIPSRMRYTECTMDEFEIFTKFLDSSKGIILYRIDTTLKQELKLKFDISPANFYGKEYLLEIQNKTQ